VFVFYLFTPPPILYRPVVVEKIKQSAHAGELSAIESDFTQAFEGRRDAARRLAHASGDPAARDAFYAADERLAGIRARAAALARAVGETGYKDKLGDTPTPDVNYVFPTFVTTRMPIGLVGLLIAAILAAAMSASAAELNSLATASVIDIYRRLIRPEASDVHYVRVSWVATAFWGAFACFVATFAAGLGSLIEVVNRFGSFFYGSLLGVFVLALAFRRANGHGAFVGLLAGIATVAAVAFHPATRDISFLWHNPLGVIVVVVVGLTVSMLTPRAQPGV
jgi:Na+/proline symporter